MDLEFTDNITKNLIDTLKPYLLKSNDIRIGVAFAKYSGFSLIEEGIELCLERSGKVEFIVGLDFRITGPRFLKTLHSMSESTSNLTLMCFSEPSLGNVAIYHPKLYILNADPEVIVSIGSSNLTRGGLATNIETNVVIKSKIDEEVVSDVYGVYHRLKFQGNKFEPDLDYIEEYEEVYERIRRSAQEALQKKDVRDRIDGLKEKEFTLPKPQPTDSELIGWQKLVYERLPEGIFKTSQMYKYEKELGLLYPRNEHVRDKIRQILQHLRDIGLLEHLRKGSWRKV